MLPVSTRSRVQRASWTNARTCICTAHGSRREPQARHRDAQPQRKAGGQKHSSDARHHMSSKQALPATPAVDRQLEALLTQQGIPVAWVVPQLAPSRTSKNQQAVPPSPPPGPMQAHQDVKVALSTLQRLSEVWALKQNAARAAGAAIPTTGQTRTQGAGPQAAAFDARRYDQQQRSVLQCCEQLVKQLETAPGGIAALSLPDIATVVGTMAALGMYDAQTLLQAEAAVLQPGAVVASPAGLRAVARLLAGWTRLGYSPSAASVTALLSGSAHALNSAAAGGAGASVQPCTQAEMRGPSQPAPTTSQQQLLRSEAVARALAELAHAMAQLRAPSQVGVIATDAAFFPATGSGAGSVPAGPQVNAAHLLLVAAAAAAVPVPTVSAAPPPPLLQAQQMAGWLQAFESCSITHMGALGLAGFTRLLTSCSQLRFSPGTDWLDAAAQQLTSALEPPTQEGNKAAGTQGKSAPRPRISKAQRQQALSDGAEALAVMCTRYTAFTDKEVLACVPCFSATHMPGLSLLHELLLRQLLPEEARQLDRQQLVQVLWAAAVLDIRFGAVSQDAVQAAVEQLHGELPLLSCHRLAGVLHALAFLRLRPYQAWRYDWEQQFLRRHGDFSREDTVAVMFALAALHPAPEVKLGAPLTTALLVCVERHMPAMSHSELKTVRDALHRLHRTLRSQQLRAVDAELGRRLQHNKAT